MPARFGPRTPLTTARRACACSQAASVGSSAVGRRSPGSSSAQPPWRARCTASDAAARTAMSSAASLAAPRGSSTTSGRVSVSARMRRSISSPVRANAGQYIRDAGAPGRCGPGPARSTPAATAGGPGRAARPVPSPSPAGVRTLAIRGSTRTSASPPPWTTRVARPNGSRTMTQGSTSRLRPRRANRASITTCAARRPGWIGAGAGSSGSSISPAGSASEPVRTRMSMRTVSSSSARRELTARSIVSQREPMCTQATAPTARSTNAAPGTYSGSASDVAAVSARTSPSSAVTTAGLIADATRGPASADAPGGGAAHACQPAPAPLRLVDPSASTARKNPLQRVRRGERIRDPSLAARVHGLRGEHDAMREHDRGERLDVVDEGVVAAAQQRARLRRAQEQQAGARARAELDAGVLARAPEQRDDVRAPRVGREHTPGGVLHGQHLGRRRYRLDLADAVAALVRAEHRDLAGGRRVAERQARHEAVDLRLGQRVGALELDRVLRREHEERPRELVGVDVDRDAALLHALEQAGLGLRRRAVDLVDEHDVREDRAGAELKAGLALVEDVRADDVGRQQVGGALDARELQLHRARERPRERRLADAGQVLEQDVTLRGDANERLVEQLLANLDSAGQRVGDPAREADGGLDLSFDDAVGILDAGHGGRGSRARTGASRDYAVARCSVRRSFTVSRTARATAAFEVRGTWRSPAAVTMVTSFSTPSKPMSFRPMSLTTTASRPLRRSLSRPYSTAPSPCSAAKPTIVCPWRRAAASAEMMSSVRSSWSVRLSLLSFLSFVCAASVGR